MTQLKLTSYFAALAVTFAFNLAACASSQVEAGPEHPASADAPQAPLQPVGEALNQDYEPGAAAAPTTAGSAPGPEHSAGQHSAAEHSAAGHSMGTSPASAQSESTSAAPATQGEKQEERWTCPMHPEVIQSKPGKCPKCGMKLVPMEPKSAPK
jgi:hypothetical protein